MNVPEYVEVRDSPIHGKGIFAKYNIRKGAHVIEYVGERISKDEAQDRYEERFKKYEKDKENHAGVFLFELDDDFDIDGDVEWNPARFINHSCEPNCETDIIDKHIWIIATRDIKAGEELFYNYGYDLEDAEDHPCFCGAKNCAGYIVDEDQWDKLKRAVKKGKLPLPKQAKTFYK